MMDSLMVYLYLALIMGVAIALYSMSKKEEENINLKISLEKEKMREQLEKKYKNSSFTEVYLEQQALKEIYIKKVKSYLKKVNKNPLQKNIWDDEDFIKEYAKLELLSLIALGKDSPDIYDLSIPSIEQIENNM